MEDHYKNFQKLLIKITIGAALFFLCLQGFGQTQVNINKTGSKPDVEVNISEKANIPFFTQAKRARAFALNSAIANPQGLQNGNKIRLQLFNNKDFSSTIVRQVTDINGVTTVTLKIDKFENAVGYIITSDNSFLLKLDIPELNEKYTTRRSLEQDETYLFLLDETKLDVLPEGAPIIPDNDQERNDKYKKELPSGNDSVPESGEDIGNFNTGSNITNTGSATVDIMIVYTTAARDWSIEHEGSIDNTIAAAMASANTVSENSGLGITFNLVYSGLVNHIEAGAGSDLAALAYEYDGVMDEVHDIRREMKADLVSILTLTGDVGGVAYLLNDKNGKPKDAFSLIRVQQASDSYTFIHELGHNMGIGHYKYQNTQPGNTNWVNWPENTWSGGWKWISTDGNYYSDVMSYGPYQDGTHSIRTPYFSDPNHIYEGSLAGDEVEGNGSRTLREIRQIISDYSNNLYCDATAFTYGPLYISNVSMGKINNSSIHGGYSNFKSNSTGIQPQETQTLTVDISGFATKKQLLVWIDWNEDRIFDPLTELHYSSEVGDVQQFVAEITAPLGTEPGQKTMRIRLHDLEKGGNSTPCGGSAIGEVEDYIINLGSPAPCTEAVAPSNLAASNINKDYYSISWQPVIGITSYEIRYRKIGVEGWISMANLKYPFQKLENLEPETTYEVQVRSICSGSPSEFSASHLTTTDAAAVMMAFADQPVSAEAGRILQPVTVHLTDASGDMNSSEEKVSLILVDPENTGATLSGELTVVAREGIATFNDLTINLQGNYSLQAIAEGLPSVESPIFSIQEFVPRIFVVTSQADNPDADLNDNACADAEGNCTLRAAIENANKTNAKEQIHFNITSTNPPVITLKKGLPAITAPLIADATTQPNYSFSTYQVTIDGSAVAGTSEADGAYAFGLMGSSSGSTIKGFTLGGFNAGLYTLAIHLRLTDNHIIEGNKIGTTVDGLSKFENYDGIYLENSNNNRIGGPLEGQRNILSGNLRAISLDNSQHNLISNNYIGTNITGNDTIPNNRGIWSGVDGRKIDKGILPTSSNNIFSNNVISGNVWSGILIAGSDNRIEKNYIGTNSTGTNSLPNMTGILIYVGNANKVGGEGTGNIISGNTQGLVIDSSGKNIISSNFIGTDKQGFLPIPNGTGIRLAGNPEAASENTIENNTISGNSEIGIRVGTNRNIIINNKVGVQGSGTAKLPNSTGIFISAGENNIIGTTSNGNVISGNLIHGIHIHHSRGNAISGNFIGALKDGSPLGNGGDGIHLDGSYQTQIGGDEGKSNTIAYNGGAAVAITENSSENSVSRNRIFSNILAGIDLGVNGITPNDRDDRDYGANQLQNFPELKSSAALEGSHLNLEYIITSAPQYVFFPLRVEFFKSDTNGQGKEYLGTDLYLESDISKGKKGKLIRLELVPGNTLNGGDKIVATATDALGNTSEFGNSVDVTGGCAETMFYADADGDGLGDLYNTQSSCTQPVGFVINSDDCDDTNSEIGTGPIWYADMDGDGFGDPDDTKTACSQPEAYVDNSEDCNDSDALVSPDTMWYGDGDGDGFGDTNNYQTACTQPEGYVENGDDCDDTNAEISAGVTWYADNDGDGLGDPGIIKTACEQPIGYVKNNEDCDDSNAESSSGITWYEDNDADGFGNPERSTTACIQPEGYVANREDCNDADAALNPDTIWYADLDADGFGDPDSSIKGCEQPSGYVRNANDCNDADAQISPNTIWYLDADGDGFGDPGITITGCEQPMGYVNNYEDCDDTDSGTNPAATDVCRDCDTTNDAGCEVECLGTDILYISEVCTNGSTVNWVINNPGMCTVEVRWELRKNEDSGNLTVPPGDTFFTSATASKGSTQVTLYWSDSNGTEIKTNANASGITCTSSSEIEGTMGDEIAEDSDPALKVYPNPVTSEGIWLHFAERNKAAQFKVIAYDLNGRKMAETVVSVDASGNDILWEVDHSRWIQGIYVLNVSSGKEVYQIKIIK